MTGIYLITNKINGKQYIGQAKDINKRIKSHIRGKLHIDKAIAKYGINNFYIDILIECPEDMLDVWERDMIALYGTYNSSRGYNHTEGGDKGPSMYGDKNPMRNINVKEKHKKMKNNMDFLKVGNYAVINLNNMFPVPKSQCTYVDISKESNPSYKALLSAEYRIITSLTERILKNAKSLYEYKMKILFINIQKYSISNFLET